MLTYRLPPAAHGGWVRGARLHTGYKVIYSLCEILNVNSARSFVWYKNSKENTRHVLCPQGVPWYGEDKPINSIAVQCGVAMDCPLKQMMPEAGRLQQLQCLCNRRLSHPLFNLIQNATITKCRTLFTGP